jgi:hypothetical protein
MLCLCTLVLVYIFTYVNKEKLSKVDYSSKAILEEFQSPLFCAVQGTVYETFQRSLDIKLTGGHQDPHFLHHSTGGWVVCGTSP